MKSTRFEDHYPRPLFYRLDGNLNPVPISLDEYISRADPQPYRVGLDECVRFGLRIKVSTVFLALDHSWFDGPPVLFETMIFGGIHNDFQQRYCTWEEAAAGHAEAVAMVRESLTFWKTVRFVLASLPQYCSERCAIAWKISKRYSRAFRVAFREHIRDWMR